MALLAFGVSVGASLYVLLPKNELAFAFIGSRAYEEFYEFRDDMEEVHRRLAYDLDRFWDANNSALHRLLWWFRLAAGALAAEIAILLAALTGSVGVRWHRRRSQSLRRPLRQHQASAPPRSPVVAASASKPRAAEAAP